jgi:hypothetical protein
MKSSLSKAILFLVGGAGLGAFLGFANQCIGGTCPLMCLWWRGAIFGAIAGLVIYFAGLPSPGRGGPKESQHEEGSPPQR